MTEQPPEMRVEPARQSLIERVSIVWVIPLLALIIALGVAWQSYYNRGPLIEIAFENASGIAAGQTGLRYRDITVGLVEDITFTDTLEKVLVKVRLQKQVAPFVDSDAVFWVVRPEVTTRGISGLDTVLSGVFIEGVWDAEPGGLARRFDGAAEAPLLRAGQSGTRISFRATADTGLFSDTPIVYKGVEVGRIGATGISPDGSAALSDAVIFDPYDRLITTATRFWDASGFTLSIGPTGAEVDFTSIASLVSGGVTFETFVSGGEPIADGDVFEVFEDVASAQSSVFNTFEGETLYLTVVFEQNVAGLTTGAPVELGGLRIGQVTNLTGVVDSARFGDRRVRLLATLSIDPGSLGLQGGVSPDETLAFLASRVEAGMRARLATASLLTGGLKVEFAIVENAAPALLDRDAQPFPLFPSTKGEISDISATAEMVLERINNLPIEELLASAIRLMETTATLVDNEELRQTPAEFRGLLADVRGVVGSDEIQALPGQLGGLMTELRSATGDLRSILASLEEAEAADRLLGAVDAAAAAATGIGQAAERLPALIAQIEAVGAKVDALPLEELVAEGAALLASADAVIDSDAARGLPAGLEAALVELRKALAGFNEQEATQRLLAAVDAAAGAAQKVSSAAEGVPALVAQIEGIAAKAEALPLEDLVAEATKLLASTDAILGTDAARQLPAEFSQTVAQLRALLSEMNEADAAGRLLAAIDAAAGAAQGVGAAVEGVPSLVARIQAVAENAEALPLTDLVTELTALTQSANALVGSEGAQALPVSLVAALDRVNVILAELQEGGVIENANKTLASARSAADAIAQSTEQLPQVVARLNAVLDQATATLAAFDDSSDLGRDARAALREVQQAADAVGSLARALKRQPNSLLLGR